MEARCLRNSMIHPKRVAALYLHGDRTDLSVKRLLASTCLFVCQYLRTSLVDNTPILCLPTAILHHLKHQQVCSDFAKHYLYDLWYTAT